MDKKKIYKISLLPGIASIIFLIIYAVWITLEIMFDAEKLLSIREAQNIINAYSFQLLLMLGLGVISGAVIIVFLVLHHNILFGEQKEQTALAVQARNSLEQQKLKTEKLNKVLQEANEVSKITEDFLMFIQQEDSLEKLTDKILLKLSEHLEASQGAFFIRNKVANKEIYTLVSSYAFKPEKEGGSDFEKGEGILGQVAKDGNWKEYKGIPKGFLKIKSGLGDSQTAYLTVLPIKYKNDVIAVVELATFKVISDTDKDMMLKLANNLGTKIGILNSKAC